MKVSELTGPELDYWVAKANSHEGGVLKGGFYFYTWDDWLLFNKGSKPYRPSEDWSQGGPLIEKYVHRIIKWDYPPEIEYDYSEFWEVGINYNAENDRCEFVQTGHTLLTAVCRCIVASVYGEEVPDEVA